MTDACAIFCAFSTCAKVTYSTFVSLRLFCCCCCHVCFAVLSLRHVALFVLCLVSPFCCVYPLLVPPLPLRRGFDMLCVTFPTMRRFFFAGPELLGYKLFSVAGPRRRGGAPGGPHGLHAGAVVRDPEERHGGLDDDGGSRRHPSRW